MSDDARVLYVCAVRERESTAARLTVASGLSTSRALTAMRELRGCGLLLASDPAGPVRPVSPAIATMLWLEPVERRISGEHHEVARLRDQFEELNSQYRAALGELPVVQVDAQAVEDTLHQLTESSTEEIRSCHPGGSRPAAGAPVEGRVQTESALRRGVRMRVLYQHSTRYDAATMDYIRWFDERGGMARTVGSELRRLVLFDEKVALLPSGTSRAGAVLVREPAVIAFVAWVFEQSWRAGRPCLTGTGASAERSQERAVTGIRLSILRLLADGHSDKVIARRLGISERTCQRHLAQVFEQLGARSRCHAGILIERSGLLHADVAELPG